MENRQIVIVNLPTYLDIRGHKAKVLQVRWKILELSLSIFPLTLKVPKHENFSIAFFALSEPIWVCDVGTAKKIEFFYRLTPDFDGFGFFAAY